MLVTPDLAFTPDSPWGRCLADFLRYVQNRSQLTYITYRSYLYRFFSASAHGGPPKMPDRYTRADVEDFLGQPSRSDRNHGKPPSPSTRNSRLTTLSSFYTYAAGYDIEGEGGELVPLLSVCSPTAHFHSEKPDRVYRSFTSDEFERFFAVIPTNTIKGLRDRALYLVYFWTARRLNEILRLRWGDIYRGIIVGDDGVSRREGWLYRYFGKGAKGQQKVKEFPGPAKIALDHYLEASGRMSTMRPEDPLFVSIFPHQHGPLSVSPVRYAMKQYARLAGLDTQRLCMHSWRHTAAQQRHAAGQGIVSLQRLLDHASLATTDLYLRGLSGTADEGVSLLEEKFAKFSRL